MATILARIVLFLSSYSPLFLILGLLNSRNADLSAVFYAITIGSILVLFLFFRTYRDMTTDQVTIKTVSSRDSDALAYIVSYLLPFLGISFIDVPTALSLGIFVVIIGIIYITSNMVYINPILSLRGYHMLEIEDGTGKVSVLVTKRSYVAPGSIIDVWSLGDFALLQKVKG